MFSTKFGYRLVQYPGSSKLHMSLFIILTLKNKHQKISGKELISAAYAVSVDGSHHRRSREKAYPIWFESCSRLVKLLDLVRLTLARGRAQPVCKRPHVHGACVTRMRSISSLAGTDVIQLRLRRNWSRAWVS